MSFLQGLFGHYLREKPTVQDIIGQEQERQFSRQIRNNLQESQELEELSSFLERQPYAQIDKSRPDNFKEYIGQNNVKDMVINLVNASKIKKTFLPHTLFWGEAGLGKTTLSYLIAKELQANLIITSGGQLENKDEILNVFKQFRDNCCNILFIDEIHAIRRRIAEMLYSAMEDYRFDYTTKNNKVVNLNLPGFTLLGATTDLTRVLVPMRQRFQNRFQLTPYTIDELCTIIKAYLNRMNYYNFDDGAIGEIALRSRNVARYCINFTKNIIDFALAQNRQTDLSLAKEYFDREGVDKEGLTRYDRQYLEFLFNSKNMRAGLNTIVKALGIDRLTVEREIEPYLLRRGYIIIGLGGRELKELWE